MQPLLFFDPDQERDDDGKWGPGGGGRTKSDRESVQDDLDDIRGSSALDLDDISDLEDIAGDEDDETDKPISQEQLVLNARIQRAQTIAQSAVAEKTARIAEIDKKLADIKAGRQGTVSAAIQKARDRRAKASAKRLSKLAQRLQG